MPETTRRTKRRSGSSRRVFIAVTVALAFSLTLLSGARVEVDAQSTTPAMNDRNLGVRVAASGLVTPTQIVFLGPNEMLVTEKQTGRVRHVRAGVVKTALDLAVNNASERGLLGIALDPNFSSNGFVYLYWTCQAPAPADPFFPSMTECPDVPALGADTGDILAVPLLGNRVDRFVWDGVNLTWDSNLIKLRAFQNDGAPIPPGQGDEGQPPAGNHDGGVITFGPDGKLYIIIGDVGRRGQLQNLPSGPTATGLGPTVPDDQFGGPAPDDAHFTGVILRLNSDGTAPADNPFFSTGASIGGEAGANIQKIFAYGIRNSFGMAFDPLSGNLWISENGDSSFDELNLVEPGFNSGWIQIMGPLNRLAEYKAIETSPEFFGLQQRRWPPDRIADSQAEALSRLFLLPGAHFNDPEFSWKFATAPAAIGFISSRALGPQYLGDLFVGFSTPNIEGGALLHFNLTGNRRMIGVDDPRLEDRVADNSEPHDPAETEPLIIGKNFGVVTDIEMAPGGNLFVASLSNGVIYEIFRRR